MIYLKSNRRGIIELIKLGSNQVKDVILVNTGCEDVLCLFKITLQQTTYDLVFGPNTKSDAMVISMKEG